ncbi:CO dehydrogenase beta subunit/acetyl-CoA synthase epsilon subunit [Hydrogenobaculum sp. Y04AAS1]|uniref:carbon monoxide dehydrogenase beta subunit family protein n=1 Tax=Hydrogenobaculum sp. (strain Y04AAS1) TaxID=380749 RepID=UPI00015BD36E|nr:CO dehydrogenase beta subunit/acetyl-CoA synthase epsilon subunit [Hydrogenobaculum sp. Y04AAS1]HCT66678.1 lipoate--protein ligase [Hydrogenobaculum sp.]
MKILLENGSINIYSFDKEYVIIGYHQDPEKEIRLDYIEKNNIELLKSRLSGQAVYVDEETIGVRVKGTKELFYERFLKAFKNIIKDVNIEGTQLKVGQKRLSVVHGDIEDGAFEIFLPFSLNIEKTLKSIHMPVEKLTSYGIKAADDRLTSVRKSIEKDISKEEFINMLLNSFYDEFGAFDIKEEEHVYFETDKNFIFENAKPKEGYTYGLYRCKGGTFRVYIKASEGVLEDIFINGDYIISPKDYIKSLENFLKGKKIDIIKDELDLFLESRAFKSIDISKEDIKEAVLFTIRKLDAKDFGLNEDALIASIGGDLKENLQKAKVMLLPYCAKPRWCDYRHLDDCGECGGCTVGDAYRLAYQKGMIPITITSFELLRDTLLWCADNGYTYIGHCCYEFYEKRYEAFQKASMFGANGVLFDIVGTTCYSLGVEEEEKAYHGEFSVELDLIKDDLTKSLAFKEDEKEFSKSHQSFDFSKYFLDFKPPYYKKPKAVPTPEEDRTRSAMQIDVFKGEATIKDSVVSYKEAFKELASLIKSSKNPTVVVGPLLFWDFNEKDLQEKAYITRLLIEKINANVKILPDYRPKLKNYDPNVEMDPPNPHEAILHGNHDITILIGTHCYRTDFVIRLLKKHTPTKVVALCGLYGHPEADLSTSFTDANKLKELLDML